MSPPRCATAAASPFIPLVQCALAYTTYTPPPFSFLCDITVHSHHDATLRPRHDTDRTLRPAAGRILAGPRRDLRAFALDPRTGLGVPAFRHGRCAAPRDARGRTGRRSGRTAR